MKNYEQLADALRDKDNIGILMHNNPDGDSISSVFAFKYLLESLGKKVKIVLHDYIPANYEFWFGKYVERISIPLMKFDCIIVLDTPSLSKTYCNHNELSDFIINIDHHKSNENYGNINIVEIVPACGIIVFNLFGYFNVPITKTVAEYLYMSICWDTDGFSNIFSTPGVYELASFLVKRGAVPQRVFNYLFYYHKKNEFETHKMFMNNTKDAGSMKYILLSMEIIKKYNVDNTDINNFMRYIKSASFSESFIAIIDRGKFIEMKIDGSRMLYNAIKQNYPKPYKINIKKSFDEDSKEIMNLIFSLSC